MKALKYRYTVLLLLFISTIVQAQAPQQSPDFLSSTGKIYVVVIVLSLIFVGILSLLVYLERRLSKLERLQSDKD